MRDDAERETLSQNMSVVRGMTEKQICALQQALDDIMAMSKEELLSDFGEPGTEYFFAELAKAEKIWRCDTNDE